MHIGGLSSRRSAAVAAFALLLGAILVLPKVATAAESTVRLKDGTEIKGTIVSEDDDSVVVKLRFGTITYRRSEIKGIEKGSDLAGGDAGHAATWRDVVLLESGEEHRGLIVSEEKDAIVFDLVMSGKSVSKTLTMRIKIAPDKVREITRLTGEQRSAARDHIENAKLEDVRDERGAKDLKVERTLWDAKDGTRRIPARKVALEHFVVEANTEEDFLRRAAYRLGKVFDAYKRHFGVDRNEAEKVRVVIFNSMEEYQAAIGRRIENPAFYSPSLKLVAAGCDMVKYRAAIDKIREHHSELTEELKAEQVKIDEAREEVRGIVEDYHKKLHVAGRTTPRGKAIMALVRRAERRWQIRVMKLEKDLRKIQGQIRLLDKRNERVFDEYAEHMLKMLYHEGFHAFLDQFLFRKEEAAYVPLWLNEGLAQYFENSRLEGSRLILGQENRPTMAFLRDEKREGRAVPLKDLLTSNSDDFLVTDGEDPLDAAVSRKHYAESWCLVHLLGERRLLKKDSLAAYVKELMKGASPVRVLPLLTGMENAEFQDLWDARLGSSIKSDQ